MSVKVHHLNCATLCPVSSLLFNGSGHLWEQGRLVCHCLLIETHDGLVLVDTGLGRADVARGKLNPLLDAISPPLYEPMETAWSQVQALGFEPHDVRHIVLTHLDLDHAGGLSDFPEAVVHLHQAEHQAAQQRRTLVEKMRYQPKQYEHVVQWQTYAPQGEKWLGFEAVRSLKGLPEDILLIPLIGHTRGHSGVAVNTATGWLFHCGDAYFHHGQVKQPVSFCPPGLLTGQLLDQMDLWQWGRNIWRLQQLYQKKSDYVQMFCSHDPVEFDHLLGI